MAVQTQIQMRRGTASTWASTNPVLAAGEIGFESDTGRIKIGDGTSTWNGLSYNAGANSVAYIYNPTGSQTTFSGADANGLTLSYTVGNEQVYVNGVLLVRGTDYTATTGTSVVLTVAAINGDVVTILAVSSYAIVDAISKTTLTAKGNLISASASGTPAIVAVGADGTTLVANSSASTGLSWAGPTFAAGKNKIINGDFGVWQRGTSFSNPASSSYTADRFYVVWNGTGATRTISQQAFTPGTAPVSGYEGKYFLRYNQSVAGTGNTDNLLYQRIEDVQTLAGQTATLSFWAKSAGTTQIQPYILQSFGSGGSADVSVANLTPTFTTSTSWTRFTATITFPSLAGKTIGTSSFVLLGLYIVGGGTFTVDFWGMQLEAGSVATPFTTATGTLQGELAACQRYYWRYADGGATYARYAPFAQAPSTTGLYTVIPMKVTMRAVPTSIDYSGLSLYDGATFFNGVTVTLASDSTKDNLNLQVTTSGLTQWRSYILLSGASTTAYIGASAEL